MPPGSPTQKNLLDEELDQRMRAGLAAIGEAGRLAADFYRRLEALSVESKGVQDVVSEADRACEERIVSALAREFPNDSFLCEESGLRRNGAAMWVIDPIDGTANFVRGIHHWAVSIALLHGTEPVLGLIFDPVAEEMFAAVKGRGATLNESAIHVSGESNLERARIGLGFSYRGPVAPHAADIETLLNAKCEYLRLGSGALGMAYTSAGRLDGYWERHINAWDVLAGLVLVQEAGGVTNDFLAGDGLFKGNEILAATPALFDPLSTLLHRS